MRPCRRLSSSRVALALLLASGFGASGCTKKSEPTYAENLVDAMRRGDAMQARGHMETIAIAVTSYVTQNGNIPEAGNIDDLALKLEPAFTRVCPRNDPWGHPYLWSATSSSWSLKCAGRDGIMDNDDDLVMEDGQLTKLPKGFTRFQQ